MRVFFAYIAPLLLVLLFLAGMMAPFAVDAYHWMPRNWWPRSLLKKK